MKTLVVAYDPISSGIGSYTIELAKLLSEINSTYIVCLNRLIEVKNVVTLRLSTSGLPSYTPLLNSLLINREIRRLYGEITPDVVLETLPPLAFNVENRITIRWGYVSYLRLAWIRSSQMPFPYNVGGVPVTIQHYFGDKLSRQNAKKIIDVSRETSDFVPPPMSVGVLKREPVQDKLQLLFVSRDIFIRRKNLKVVLEALSLSNGNYVLHIVGNGKIQRDNVVCHGYVPREKVLQIMNECDALILPSTYEEVGYVGLEAYSIGLPVIASDIPSFRAIFKKSLFFHPDDPWELAELLKELNRDSLQKMGIESRRFLMSSNEIAKKRLLEIYSSLHS